MASTPDGRTVLVLISGRGGGDVPPVLALAEGLHARGYRVQVVCDAATRPMVDAAHLDAIPLPAELEQAAYFARHATQLGTVDGLPRMVYPLREWGEVCLPALQSTFATSRPAVIVSSLFCSPLADVLATAAGIPWCFVNPSYYFGDDSPRAWEEDFAEPSRSAFRDDFQPLMRRANLVIHATDRQLDFPPPRLPAHHHYVGPILWEAPQPAPADIDTSGDPWVLVSLSSVPQPGDLEIARATMTTLRDDPLRVLVTLAATHDTGQLGDIPGNASFTTYVPHSAVLPATRLVVSHAGHGIVMKSLSYGVPMVLVPLGRDQPGVAARAAAAGVAEVIAPAERSPERISSAIRRVLREPRYQTAAAAVARRLRAEQPVERAVRFVESIAADA